MIALVSEKRRKEEGRKKNVRFRWVLTREDDMRRPFRALHKSQITLASTHTCECRKRDIGRRESLPVSGTTRTSKNGSPVLRLRLRRNVILRKRDLSCSRGLSRKRVATNCVALIAAIIHTYRLKRQLTPPERLRTDYTRNRRDSFAFNRRKERMKE